MQEAFASLAALSFYIPVKFQILKVHDARQFSDVNSICSKQIGIITGLTGDIVLKLVLQEAFASLAALSFYIPVGSMG